MIKDINLPFLLLFEKDRDIRGNEMNYLKIFEDWAQNMSNRDFERQITQIVKRINVQYKHLKKQIKQLDEGSHNARQKARDLRKKGDDNASRVQMKAHLQMQARKNNIECIQLMLEGFRYELGRSPAIEQVPGILAKIVALFPLNPDLAHSLFEGIIDIDESQKDERGDFNWRGHYFDDFDGDDAK